eukprot:9225064-Ditylum_brightwellii.AAC.1
MWHKLRGVKHQVQHQIFNWTYSPTSSTHPHLPLIPSPSMASIPMNTLAWNSSTWTRRESPLKPPSWKLMKKQ